MTQTDQHIVILPYFCQEEVERYQVIAKRLEEFPKPKVAHTYVLAASPRTEPSQQLYDTFAKLGPTKHFQCPTQIFGYPEGPTAMFWDCMDFVAAEYPGNSGFSLWLESDMAPIKPDWLDRLSDEWYAEGNPPVMMGCYVPDVYKYRLFKKKKLILDAHINGGACYASDFATRIATEARTGVFDVVVYRHAQEIGRAKGTNAISFSTMNRVRRDLMDDEKVLLHGYLQEKDEFVQQCVTPVTERERRSANWVPIQNKLESMKRRVKVYFFRKGKKAMLDNMFNEKEKLQARRAA